MKTWRPLLAMVGLLAVAACSRGCGKGGEDGSDAQTGGAADSAGIGGATSGSAGIAGVAKGGGGQARAGAPGGAGQGGVISPLGGMGLGGKAGSAGAPIGFGGGALNDGIPKGWELFTGWSDGCPVYYPPTPDLLPEPLKWEPCGGNIPTSYDCRELRHDTDPPFHSLRAGASIVKNPETGAPTLHTTRYLRTGEVVDWMFVAAEVDGPMQAALAQRAPHGNQGCIVDAVPASGGYWAMVVLGESLLPGSPRDKAGGIVGRYGSSMPTHLFRREGLKSGEVTVNWYPSAPTVVEHQYGMYGIDWDTGDRFKIYHADDPNALPANRVSFSGDQVFVDVGGLQMHGFYVWDKKAGTRPLLRWVDDFTRSAAHFATDGKDMVWTLMEKDSPTDSTWTKMSVMTAPYTLDRDELLAKARRLTADEPVQHPDSWQVGCGFGARRISSQDFPNSLLVVRLSDGAWWRISPSTWGGQPDFGDALAVTCDEVFAGFYGVGTPFTIARIRLDSLGPPNPPN